MDWIQAIPALVVTIVGTVIATLLVAELTPIGPKIGAALQRRRVVLRLRQVRGGGAWEVENCTRSTLFELRYALSGDSRALTPSEYADSDVRDLAPGMSVRLVGFSHVAGQTAGFDWIECSGRRGGLVTFAKDRTEYSIEREPLPKPRRGRMR